MKRKISLLLALLALMNLAACGDAGTPDETTSSAQTGDTTPATTELTDGLPDTDMQGFTLNILHHNDEWLTWARTQLRSDEENGDLINDAVYRRNSYIEERFKCVLNIEEVKQTAGMVQSIVMSGSDEYDIIFQYGLNVLGNIDYLANFDNIPHLSLDEEYWNPAATEVFKVGDKQLAVAGNWTLSYLSGATTYCFNKKIWDEIGDTDLYKLVEDGKWTTDAFYSAAKLAPRDLNGDGKIVAGEDLIGMAGQSKAYWNTLIIGAGFRYVGFDDDHNPYFNLKGNEKMINFLQKIVETESANEYIYPVSNDMLTSGYLPNASPDSDFTSDQNLFQQAMIFAIESNFREMQSDFGILPAPKYDEAQENYLTYANIGEIATLPRSFDSSRADYIGTLMEAMSFYSQQNIVPAYKETVLQVKLSRDEDSAKMLDYVFGNIVFDYGTVVWENAITGPIITKYLMPRSSELVSTIESMDASLKTSIEKLLTSAVDVP